MTEDVEDELLEGYADLRKQDIIAECWKLQTDKLKKGGIDDDTIEVYRDMYYGGAMTVMHYVRVARDLIQSTKEGSEEEEIMAHTSAAIMKNLAQGVRRYKMISTIEDLVNEFLKSTSDAPTN